MLEERTNSTEQAKLLKYIETLNDTRVRRCVNTDEALVVTRDVRGEIVVAMVHAHELRGYRVLQGAILERTWPPQVVGYEQYTAR